MERPATWKVLTLGAALTGLGVTGAGFALADENGGGSNDMRPISVSSAPAADAPTPLAPLAGDLSPESADSPFESPMDSADSPFDSPDDVDDTPDVDGSPDNTPDNTPDDTPDDTPGDDTPDD